MSTNQPRQPAGTPVGGQWAAATHAEPDVELTPEEHRRLAREADDKAYESFERSDTDGFLSQWALGLSAQKHRLAAEIAEAGGRAEFPALFDLEGNLVPAKLVRTQYGTSWAVLADEDDPHGEVAKWVGRSRAESPERQVETMEKKGYREGTVRARAKADIVGTGHGLSGTAWVTTVRVDGGFSRDVEVVDDGTRAAAVADLVSLAKNRKIGPEDLDDDVHDAMAEETEGPNGAERTASLVNNGGLWAQIDYLVERNSPDAVRRRLETGSWDMPAPKQDDPAPKDWWPVVESDRRPGEKALSCPKCGAQDVTITGSNLGSDVVRGNNYTRLVCGSCGNSQDFRKPTPR